VEPEGHTYVSVVKHSTNKHMFFFLNTFSLSKWVNKICLLLASC
jgi:hypothetical protein